MTIYRGRLLRSSLWNWLLFGTTALMTFFISPFLVRVLGSDRYGLWTVAVSLCGYYGLLDVGTRNALVRFVARYHGEENPGKLSDTIDTCLVLFGVAAIGVTVLVLGIVTWLPRIFRIDASMLDEARSVVLVLGLGFAAQFPLNALAGILVGMQRYDVQAQAWIAAAILQNLLYYIFLSRSGGVVTLALISAIGSLFTLLYLAYRGWRCIPGLQVHWRKPDRTMVRELFGYSTHIFVIGVASRLFTYTAPLVIGARIDMRSVALYAIPVTLISYASNIVSNFCRVLQPYASQAQATGNQEELKTAGLWSVTVSLMIYVPIFIVVILSGTEFVDAWMGREFREGARIVLPVLASAYLLAIAEMPLENLMMGAGAVRFLAQVLLGESVVCVGLMAILLPRLGIAGAAWGTAVPMLVSRGILIPLAARRVLGIRLRGYYWSCLGKCFVMAIPVGLALLAVQFIHPARGYARVTRDAVGAVCLYGVTAGLCTAEGRRLLRRVALGGSAVR